MRYLNLVLRLTSQQKVGEQSKSLAAIPFLKGDSESSILVCVVWFFAIQNSL